MKIGNKNGMQLLIGAGLAGVALTLPMDGFLRYSLMFLWLLAFSSATHDIAADGFYMLGLTQHQQAWFVGVRSTFYRLAMIAGQTVLATPIVANLVLAAVTGADQRIINTALTLGASRFQAAIQLLREIRFGVMAAVIAGFGRVIAPGAFK